MSRTNYTRLLAPTPPTQDRRGKDWWASWGGKMACYEKKNDNLVHCLKCLNKVKSGSKKQSQFPMKLTAHRIYPVKQSI